MSILLFLSFITLIFIGFPVAWTMGGLAVLFTLISMLSDAYLDTFFGVDWKFASMVVYRLYGVMANWVLVALPMFIFMGYVLSESKIADDLYRMFHVWMGGLRGGLARGAPDFAPPRVRGQRAGRLRPASIRSLRSRCCAARRRGCSLSCSAAFHTT